jgi:hypothetical protein
MLRMESVLSAQQVVFNNRLWGKSCANTQTDNSLLAAATTTIVIITPALPRLAQSPRNCFRQQEQHNCLVASRHSTSFQASKPP